MLFYYENFDKFKQLNLPPFLYGLMIPLLFIGNIGPILVVSIISLINIYIYPELPFIEEVQKEEAQTSDEEEEEDDDEEEEEDDDEEEEAQTSENEEEDSDCKRNCKEEDSDCKRNCKEEDSDCRRNCKEEDSDCNCEEEDGPPELIETVNSYLIILAVKNTNHKYILTTTNELIATYKSKLLELGSIKLNSIIINLIVLEIDVSESDIQQLKQDNELYDYTIFDDTLNILEDVKLECIWRRYKHILKENEYKDNTYTIL